MAKAAVLFSGGKDSCYSAYLAKKQGYELTCLITMLSENPDSYMFHTPSIKQVTKQAAVMKLPLIIAKTKGEKELELIDLKNAIKRAKKEYGIDTIITGAIHSEYQASRIQKICDSLKLNCFNPLWQKDEFEYLDELIAAKFNIIVVGVSAEPLDETWLGRKIDKKFVEDVKKLYEKYKIHPAGEGGEFETFVLRCPLFKEPLEVKKKKITGEGHSWKMEITLG